MKRRIFPSFFILEVHYAGVCKKTVKIFGLLLKSSEKYCIIYGSAERESLFQDIKAVLSVLRLKPTGNSLAESHYYMIS